VFQSLFPEFIMYKEQLKPTAALFFIQKKERRFFC